MAETVEFVVKGKPISLNREDVLNAMEGERPQPIRGHAVAVDGVWYPVNQVFAKATGLANRDFASPVACRQLALLGFDLKRRHALSRARRLCGACLDCGALRWAPIGRSQGEPLTTRLRIASHRVGG